MTARLTLAKVELFEIAARQIAETDVSDDLRDRLTSVVAEVTALFAPAGNPADHMPVFIDRDQYPDQMAQIGCTCGERPRKPNQRMSTMLSFYFGHLARLNLPRPANDVINAKLGW